MERGFARRLSITMRFLILISLCLYSFIINANPYWDYNKVPKDQSASSSYALALKSVEQ